MSGIAKHWIDGEWTGSAAVSESSDLEHHGQCSDAGRHRAGAPLPLESSSDRYRGSMSEGARQDAEKPPVKWLTAAEVLLAFRLVSW